MGVITPNVRVYSIIIFCLMFDWSDCYFSAFIAFPRIMTFYATQLDNHGRFFDFFFYLFSQEKTNLAHEFDFRCFLEKNFIQWLHWLKRFQYYLYALFLKGNLTIVFITIWAKQELCSSTGGITKMNFKISKP